MSKSIGKNYIFNLVYQVLVLIVPLITTPYISRILGAGNIGQYSYTQSIVTFFILFGSMGIAMYGQREIAYSQFDKKQTSRVFWSILSVRFLLIAIVLTVYAALIIWDSKYRILYVIQIIDILAASLDINWFYQGMEDFKRIVLRNIIIKALSVIAIFTFVKTSSDLYLYVLCLSIPLLLGNLSLWFSVSKHLTTIKIRELDLAKHFLSAVKLFLPQFAMQVYTILDKAMLEWLGKSDVENGYYEQSQKVFRMVLSIVTAMGTVMASRIAIKYKENNKEAVVYYLKKSFHVVWALGLPLTFGLASISSIFVPWFYGDGYAKVSILLKIFSMLCVIVGLSNVIGLQFLVPTGKENKLTISVISGSLLNVILNMILIPIWQSAGAAIASIFAEMLVTGLQFYFIRNEISVKSIFKMSVKYLISSVVMSGVVLLLGNLSLTGIVLTFVQIAVGGSVYFAMVIILKDDFIFPLLCKLLGKIKDRGIR